MSKKILCNDSFYTYFEIVYTSRYKDWQKTYLNVSNVRNPKKMRLSNTVPKNIFVVDENLRFK